MHRIVLGIGLLSGAALLGVSASPVSAAPAPIDGAALAASAAPTTHSIVGSCASAGAPIYGVEVRPGDVIEFSGLGCSAFEPKSGVVRVIREPEWTSTETPPYYQARPGVVQVLPDAKPGAYHDVRAYRDPKYRLPPSYFRWGLKVGDQDDASTPVAIIVHDPRVPRPRVTGLGRGHLDNGTPVVRAGRADSFTVSVRTSRAPRWLISVRSDRAGTLGFPLRSKPGVFTKVRPGLWRATYRPAKSERGTFRKIGFRVNGAEYAQLVYVR